MSKSLALMSDNQSYIWGDMRYMKKNKKNKKKLNGYPNGVDRMDKELMSEIKMYYSLCNDVKKTAEAYHVSESMVKYAINKGIEFDKIGGIENDGSSKR